MNFKALAEAGKNHLLELYEDHRRHVLDYLDKRNLETIKNENLKKKLYNLFKEKKSSDNNVDSPK